MKKLVLVLAFGLAVLTIGTAVVMMETCEGPDRGTRHPSVMDQPAIEFFTAHRQQFERLRELLQSSKLIYYHPEHTLSPPDAFAGSPDIRNEVTRLMSELELQSVNGPASSWGIRLSFRSTGMAMGGTDKGFWFGEPPPSRVVPAIDNFTPDTPDSASVFRAIAPPWYLRFDWGG